MRWGKFILFFQAVMTLLIGIVFLLQVFNIQYNYEEQIKEDYNLSSINPDLINKELLKYYEFKNRFFIASYILAVVALIEMIIIWRMFNHEDIALNNT
jgi:uncharacterized protein (UPF0212 family)